MRYADCTVYKCDAVDCKSEVMLESDSYYSIPQQWVGMTLTDHEGNDSVYMFFCSIHYDQLVRLLDESKVWGVYS